MLKLFDFLLITFMDKMQIILILEFISLCSIFTLWIVVVKKPLK